MSVATQDESASAPLYVATLWVAPVPKGRPRLTKAGKAFTPGATRRAEGAIRWALRAAGPQVVPVDGPLLLRLRFVLARPARIPRARRWPSVRPDLDNYIKLVMDAANGLLWVDDGQVVCIHACKEYGPKPCVMIELRAAPAETN